MWEELTKERKAYKPKIEWKKLYQDSVKTVKRKNSQEVGELDTEQKLGRFFRTVRDGIESLFVFSKEAVKAVNNFHATAMWIGVIAVSIAVIIVLIKFL